MSLHREICVRQQAYPVLGFTNWRSGYVLPWWACHQQTDWQAICWWKSVGERTQAISFQHFPTPPKQPWDKPAFYDSLGVHHQRDSPHAKAIPDNHLRRHESRGKWILVLFCCSFSSFLCFILCLVFPFLGVLEFHHLVSFSICLIYCFISFFDFVFW